MFKPTLKAVMVLMFVAVIGAQAKVDLVTLPERESVQITIYNKADLTLVRDQRVLTFSKGMNRLQFSWANTLIDPTSLDIEPQGDNNQLEVKNISYPPRVKETGVWHIHAEEAGRFPVEITYFTSGLSWRSFYMATLSQDEKTMKLKGYVRVTNKSGEDYGGAKTRLVVGKINLLDRIAELARREAPYGKPTGRKPRPPGSAEKRHAMKKVKRAYAGAAQEADADRSRPKEIKKEGLSEYFLYTIEGTETIPDGSSKRLPSFEAESVEVTNFYKYDEQRYEDTPVRFLRFRNDEEHNLGQTPLPGGEIKVYGSVNKGGNLRYIGTDNTRYIPVDQKVELNLGKAQKVKVKPKVMDYRKKNIVFDNDGDVDGFDEIKDYRITLNNYSDQPAKLEVTRHLPSKHWELENNKTPGEYEKVDQSTVKYTVRLKPHEETQITYTLTVYHGDRRYRR